MMEQLLYSHSLVDIDYEAVLEEVKALIADVRRKSGRLPRCGYHLHDFCRVSTVLNPRRLA